MIKLTDKQKDDLLTAYVMAKANGRTAPGIRGSRFRSLEAKGLFTSRLHGSTRGARPSRSFYFTDEGLAVAEALYHGGNSLPEVLKLVDEYRRLRNEGAPVGRRASVLSEIRDYHMGYMQGRGAS